MEQVRIEINGWRDESTLAKQTVSLVFVPEGTEVEVVDSGRLVDYQANAIPAKFRTAVPVLHDAVRVARVGGVHGAASLQSFLTKMSDGTYIVAIKKELWKAYRAFMEAGAAAIRKMTNKSVVALLASIERAFEAAKQLEAEEVTTY